MDKDLNKIIKRLLHISKMIIDEFEVMSDLSYKDMEETSAFNDHIEDTKNYLNAEAVILNNLKYEELIAIFKKMSDYEDDSDEFERAYLIIDGKIETLNNSDEMSETEEIEDIPEEDSEDIVLDYSQDENDFVHTYYLDTGELEKYEVATIDATAINALKKMSHRINSTYTDNKKDNKFKKRLLKDLKSFKYIILSLDLNLERIGVNYHFNIERIPQANIPDVDTSTISYNQCIIHLNKLYHTKKEANDVSDINENLFNMICFEAFLEAVDTTLLNRLLLLCQELEDHVDYPYYGNIAKEKILKKVKN